MNSIKSKVSYLSGLCHGLNIDFDSKEGKIIKELIYILKDMSYEIEELKDIQRDMQDYIDSIDEDVTILEDEIYEEDDEYDFDYDSIENFVDFKCSNCGEKIYVDTKVLNEKDEVVCPNCKGNIPTKLNYKCSCNDHKNYDEFND